MGHWGTCPVDLQQHFFSSLRSCTRSTAANFIWFPVCCRFENVLNRQREAFCHVQEALKPFSFLTVAAPELHWGSLRRYPLPLVVRGGGNLFQFFTKSIPSASQFVPLAFLNPGDASGDNNSCLIGLCVCVCVAYRAWLYWDFYVGLLAGGDSDKVSRYILACTVFIG